MNRDYIAPTAAMVDARLAELGFLPLPQLKPKPYLSGEDAKKANILGALKNLAILTKEGDVAVVYYIGHGNLAPSYKDLSLGVYDEAVGGSTGLRFTDLLGYLEYTKWFSSVTQIPHYLIVLDACLSGNIAAPRVELEYTKNIPTIKDVEMIVVPPQIAILTATEDGDDKLAYSLQGTNYSAFGYYFARALKEDWACSDKITPDGILTLNELHSYIKSELKAAKENHLIQAEMKPNIVNKQGEAFIAYDPHRHFIDGARKDVVELYIQPNANQEASITLPTGEAIRCYLSSGCSTLVSRNLVGTLNVRITDKPPAWSGAYSVDPPKKPKPTALPTWDQVYTMGSVATPINSPPLQILQIDVNYQFADLVQKGQLTIEGTKIFIH